MVCTEAVVNRSLSSNIDEPLPITTNVSEHNKTQHAMQTISTSHLTHKTVNARDIHSPTSRLKPEWISPRRLTGHMENFQGPVTANKLYEPLNSNLSYFVLQNGSKLDHSLIINHPEQVHHICDQYVPEVNNFQDLIYSPVCH